MEKSYISQCMAVSLARMEGNGRLRTLRCVQGVNLCSNDYLGLALHEGLKAAVCNAVQSSERVGSTGSRLLSGHVAAWGSLEEEFAAFAGTEASLFFNSGFAANTGLLPALLQGGDVVFSDALNHASLIDGIRLSGAQKEIYRHGDMNALEDALRRHSGGTGGRVIVTESIFSMDGDHAPLREIFQLAERYGAEVIVDEAHATCTYGPGGRGLAAEHGWEDRCLAVVHTCSKALAGIGAFVCGSKTLKAFLMNSARSFIFSTALPPYMALQIQAALRLASSMEAERRHLASLAEDLRARLRGFNYGCEVSHSQIVPLIVGSNQGALDLAAALEQQGFAVRAVRSPSVPPGTERLRISLTADLSAEVIQNFIDAVISLSAIGVAHG
jgi:8-amino-7-oxononanoate synthase